MNLHLADTSCYIVSAPAEIHTVRQDMLAAETMEDDGWQVHRRELQFLYPLPIFTSTSTPGSPIPQVSIR